MKHERYSLYNVSQKRPKQTLPHHADRWENSSGETRETAPGTARADSHVTFLCFDWLGEPILSTDWRISITWGVLERFLGNCQERTRVGMSKTRYDYPRKWEWSKGILPVV